MHQLFERYITLLEQKQRDVKTIRQNVQALRHLDDYFSLWKIDPAKATDDDLCAFFAAQQIRYAYNTCNGRLKVIRGVYGWAVRTKQVEHDPTREVGLGRPTEREPETLSNDELRSILAACQDDRERMIFLVLAYTGMRKEEVLTLKWEEVDWPNAELRVVGKFKKFRKVPIHPVLQEALAEAYDRRREGQRYVVESNRKDRISPAHGHLLWRRVMDRAGLTQAKPFHAFRATVNTVLNEQGVRDDVRDKILGWAPVTVSARFYTRTADNSKHEGIRALYQDDPIWENAKTQLERVLLRVPPAD
jgi:integrase